MTYVHAYVESISHNFAGAIAKTVPSYTGSTTVHISLSTELLYVSVCAMFCVGERHIHKTVKDLNVKILRPPGGTRTHNLLHTSSKS
jgi:hypothetical protein